jgi:hypothetical protein
LTSPVSHSSDTPDAAPAPVFSGSVTTDSIYSIWPQLVEQLRTQNGFGSFLNQAKPGEFRNGTLTLYFSDNGQGQLAVDYCKKRNDVLESGIRQVVGQNVAIKYELTKNEIAAPVSVGGKVAPAAPAVSAAPAAAAAPPQAPAQPSPAARVSRQQQDEVLSDPAVKLIMVGLSARPMNIERIESEENEHTDNTEEQV